MSSCYLLVPEMNRPREMVPAHGPVVMVATGIVSAATDAMNMGRKTQVMDINGSH